MVHQQHAHLTQQAAEHLRGLNVRRRGLGRLRLLGCILPGQRLRRLLLLLLPYFR